MQFIDEVEIEIKAGKGGNGIVAWRKEKYVPKGGPAGGDGGNGGDVIFVSDDNLASLLDFRFKPKWEAKDGANGMSGCKDGPSGEDLIISVPVGTQLLDAETEELIADFDQKDQKQTICKGGSGGWGNTHFTKASRQAPDFAYGGLEGEQRSIKLSLKLLADVGLLGYPNAGKSTLLSKISAAKPKIANYPFTTLNPQLGVVFVESKKSFVVADIPGIIRGASEGHGLGIRFLKHLERVKVLAHLIEPDLYCEDDSAPDLLVEKYKEIREELNNYSAKLSELPEIIILSKSDLFSESLALDPNLEKQINNLKSFCEQNNKELFEISSHTGDGIKKLVYKLWSFVEAS